MHFVKLNFNFLMIKNSSFLYSDITRTSNHRIRKKKHDKRKIRAARRRKWLKFCLLYSWNTNNVKAWVDSFVSLNKPNSSKMRTIKNSCHYSDRIRSTDKFLKLSKYQIAKFTRLGLIKDLKRH